MNETWWVVYDEQGKPSDILPLESDARALADSFPGSTYEAISVPWAKEVRDVSPDDENVVTPKVDDAENFSTSSNSSPIRLTLRQWRDIRAKVRESQRAAFEAGRELRGRFCHVPDHYYRWESAEDYLASQKKGGK